MAETKDSPEQSATHCEHMWEETGELIAEEYIHGWIKEYVSTEYMCKLCGATERGSESKRWR